MCQQEDEIVRLAVETLKSNIKVPAQAIKEDDAIYLKDHKVGPGLEIEGTGD